jgi:hypothetical protein
VVFIASEGEVFTTMCERGYRRSAIMVEFEEASDEMALNYLRDRLGKEKFDAKESELTDLVRNYAGGNFWTLSRRVGKSYHDLPGEDLIMCLVPELLISLCYR